jgi:O-antigen/teichoic acid export membrane protein
MSLKRSMPVPEPSLHVSEEPVPAYDAIRKRSTLERLRFLAADSVYYGTAMAISKLMGVFTVPVLARAFSSAQFGLTDALAVWTTMFALIASMGQDSAVARFFYEAETEEERKQVVGEALLIQLGFAVTLSIVLLLAGRWLAPGLFSSTEAALPFRIVAISIPFVVVVQFWRNLLKWTFQRGGFAIVSLAAPAAIFVLTVVFAVVLHQGVLGVFVAQAVANIVFACIGAYLCRRYVALPKGFQWGPALLRVGFPYMLVAVASAAMPAMDRFFITHRLDLDAMGRYAVAYKFASLVSLPIMAFQTAWGPFSLAIYKEADVTETYDRAFSLYAALMSFLIFILTATAEPLLMIFASRNYVSVAPLVVPIAFGFLIESIAWMTGIGIDLSKKTYGSAISYAVGTAVSAAAIGLLIRPFGIAGVAWGVLAGRAVQAMTYTALAHRFYPLRLAWTRPVFLIAFALAAAILIRLPVGSNPLAMAAARSAAACVVFTLAVTIGMTHAERQIIISRARRVLGRASR